MPIVALGGGIAENGPVTSTWSLNNFASSGGGSAYQFVFTRYDGTTQTDYTAAGFTAHLNTWYHVAVSRVSGTLRIFINGTPYYAAANAMNFTAINTTDPLILGFARYAAPSNFYLSGYLQEIRITNGVGRYVNTFTPPSTPDGDI